MPHVDEGTLHAYLDGELPSAERKTLEAHLAECASCRATLEEERALLDRASALLGTARPTERPAPPFEQLGVPRAPTRSPWRVRTPVAWAASIALALGIGYYLRQPSTGPAASAPEQHDVALGQQANEEARFAQPADRADENRPAPGTPRSHAAARAPSPVPAPAPSTVAAVAVSTPQAPPLAVARDIAEGVVKTAPVAKTDSGAASALIVDGVIVRQQSAASQSRNAAPAPAPALEYMSTDSLTRGAAGVSQVTSRQSVELRGRATTTSWPIISRGTARSLLGTDPVGLPGLARQIRRSPAADGTVVVEQRIDSATTIQIFQRQSGTAALDSSAKAEIAPADRLARYLGRLRVEISGPLSTDSLNKLLDQVQPLP